MKKLMSLLLVIMMLASCIPAFADDTWTVSASGAVKVNSGVTLSGEVVIPDVVDGVTVTSLDGFAFNNQNGVTSIVMPDTVQSMSGSAINFLNGLTGVKLSENLTVIDDMNFCAMNGLTSLTIPASVCFIGDSMTSLQSLQTLTFEGVCPMFGVDNALNGLNRNCVIYVPDDQVDAYKAALTNGYGTEEQVQPSGKNAVIYDNPADESEFVFDAATGAITGYTGTSARLQIPATIGGAPVKAIAEKAFSHNSALCFVVIPEGVETIGNYAFDYCDNLVVVDFPSTLKKIGDSAFEGCYLSNVGWKEGLEEIGANAFSRYGVQTLALPSTVKTIGEAAFKNGSIRKLYIGNQIESIGPEAFANNFLDRVELLTDRMIQIDETAFAGNTNDTYVYLRWNVPYDVYKEYEHLFLNIYEGITYLYIQAPIKDPALGLEYPADGTDSYDQDVWVSYNGTQPNLMTWYSWNRIPITTLGDGLFKGNQTIKSWYCSHEFTMHHIGNEAFADSSVEFVDLYHEIYTIGEHAFRNCVNIKEITLPETLTSIAANAFEGCTGLEKITILCDPSILPAGLLDSCTALTEISAGENATEEQKAALQKAIFGKEIVITQQPAGVTVGEGGTANIEVQLESTEGLSFTWYVRNAADKDFAVDAAQTGNVYSIVVDASCNGRVVYCVISDDYGTVVETDTAMISIAAPVEITKQPEGATLPEGAQANVTIEVAGESPVYAWYVNDALYADCTGNVFNAIMSAELDGAQVHCVVTDAYGKSASSEKAVLKLAAQLAITVQPATAELPEGEMTAITVEATGDGLTYQWYVMPVSKSEFAVAEGFNTNVYSVPVDFDSDWSQVYCVITDAYGNSVTSETATIYIAEPEVVVPVGEVDASMVGHWVTVSANVEGMVLTQEQLESFGMSMWIDLNADGTAAMFMEGEEMGGISWSVADGMLVLTLGGDAMMIEILEDGTLSMEGIIFALEGSAPVETPVEAPVDTPAVVIDPSNVFGKWVATGAEMDGMKMDKAMLESFGLTVELVVNEDGTASLGMGGEVEDGLTWTAAEAGITLSIDGDSMTATYNDEGGLTMDFDGAYMFLVKEGAESSDAAPVETPTEAPAAEATPVAAYMGEWTDGYGQNLLFTEDGKCMVNGEIEWNWEAANGEFKMTWGNYIGEVVTIDADGTMSIGGFKTYYRPGAEVPSNVPATVVGSVEDFVGTWNASVMEMEGMTMNVADMGMVMDLTITADGKITMFDGESTDEGTWTLADGVLDIMGEMQLTLTEDGRLCMAEDGAAMYFVRGEASAPEAEPAIEAEPAPEVEPDPVAGEYDGYVGTWKACYLSTGGLTGDLRTMGITSTLILNADGTGSIDFPTPETGSWYVEDGYMRFGENGMPMTLLDGSFLKFGSDLAGYIVFSQDENAVWDPSMDAPAAPVEPEVPVVEPAEPAAPVAADDVDMMALMNRKYVAKTYTAYGQTMDASMLGAEYSLLFRENGTCDFGMAGMVVPNLPWGLEKVAVGLTEVDAFVINYYGTMFNAVLTEAGFDMDFYGTMTLHFEPAE